MQLPLSLAISSHTELIGRNAKSASEPSVDSLAHAASFRSSVISSSELNRLIARSCAVFNRRLLR